MFSVPCKKKVTLYLISLSLRVIFIEIPDTFLCSGYVSRHVQSFKGFGKNLLKLEPFKDKTLIRISVLQHIHHKTRPISSAFNARRK